jgi:hypothetical protein
MAVTYKILRERQEHFVAYCTRIEAVFRFLPSPYSLVATYNIVQN